MIKERNKMRTRWKYGKVIQEDRKSDFDWLDEGEGGIFSLTLSFTHLL